jgi:hypothetical protein
LPDIDLTSEGKLTGMMLPRFLPVFLPVFLAVLALAGCQAADGLMRDLSSVNVPGVSGDRPAKGSSEYFIDSDCPSIEIVPELTALSEFAPEGSTDPRKLLSHVVLTETRGSCTYKNNSVTVELTMTFEGTLGPAGKQAEKTAFFAYPFFVAVVDSGGDILAKEVFAASIGYENGADTQIHKETIRQIIPIVSRSDGRRHKIMTGFQLTPEQLAYNRKRLATESAAP